MAHDQSEPSDQHHETSNGTARSEPLPPKAAERLETEIERLGVDGSQMSVGGQPALGVEEVGRVDRASMARPVRRALLGAAVGAVALLIAGIVVVALTSVPPAPVVVMAIIIGALLGGLWSLYVDLPANPGVRDVYTGEPSTVEANLAGLDQRTSERVEQAMDRAGAHEARLGDEQAANPASRPLPPVEHRNPTNPANPNRPPA